MAVDRIVNAANNQLKHGGGVCGAILAAAGAKELRTACHRYVWNQPHCSYARFKLKAKHIIHAVGPHWQDGKHYEAEMLCTCYRRAMKKAPTRFVFFRHEYDQYDVFSQWFKYSLVIEVFVMKPLNRIRWQRKHFGQKTFSAML